MKEADVRDRWIVYLVASVLIHGAILSIPTITKIPPHTAEPIEVFLLEGDGSSSPGGGGGTQDKPRDVPRRGAPGPAKKEAVEVRPRQHAARPVEHRAEPLPPTAAHTPGNELATSKDPVGVSAPATGVAVAGGGGAGGSSAGTGGGSGGGTGAGSGPGKGDGGGVGFGSPGGPRFLRREVPEYPWLARRHRKEGSVLLMVAIDAAGRLTKVDVIEASDKIFVGPSLEAVRKSTFLPARRNNYPVDSRAYLPIRFSLTE